MEGSMASRLCKGPRNKTNCGRYVSGLVTAVNILRLNYLMLHALCWAWKCSLVLRFGDLARVGWREYVHAICCINGQ